MNPEKGQNTARSAGPGEGYGGETPQVSNRYYKTLLSAQSAWFMVATAESCLRFLGTAQEKGVNTNDVQNFLENQKGLRKIKTDDKHNSKIQRVHFDVGNNIMSLKVADQTLVLDEARTAREGTREDLRAAAPSGKSFRRSIAKLNYMSRDLAEELDSKNKSKLDHLSRKLESISENGEIPKSTTTRIRHKFDSVYPSLSIYKETPDDDIAIAEEIKEIKSKEEPIIIGDLDADKDEKDVLTMNPKKPIQMEPKLAEFQVDMEMFL